MAKRNDESKNEKKATQIAPISSGLSAMMSLLHD
jgi:hypothetical protein